MGATCDRHKQLVPIGDIYQLQRKSNLIGMLENNDTKYCFGR